MATDRGPRLAVIIVNYRVPRFVEQALRSLRAAAVGLSVEVYVVDNDSRDGSLDYLTPRFPEVHFIANTHNEGFAKANNLAIRSSGSSDYVLLLNPDTVIGNSTLHHLLDHMEAHPEAGACGVYMQNARGDYLPESKRGKMTLWATFCKLSGLATRFPHSRLVAGYYQGWQSEYEPHTVTTLSGACMMLRRTTLEKAGLLDERYFMYGEDIDLSYSVAAAGYSCHYLPTPILHYKGESESASANPARYKGAFYGAMKLFYRKHYPRRVLTQKLVALAAWWLRKRTKNSPKVPSLQTPIAPTPIDLMQPDPLTGIGSGESVLVELAPHLYDRLLEVMQRARGLGHIFFLHDSETGVTLGPGGELPASR